MNKLRIGTLIAITTILLSCDGASRSTPVGLSVPAVVNGQPNLVIADYDDRRDGASITLRGWVLCTPDIVSECDADIVRFYRSDDADINEAEDELLGEVSVPDMEEGSMRVSTSTNIQLGSYYYFCIASNDRCSPVIDTMEEDELAQAQDRLRITEAEERLAQARENLIQVETEYNQTQESLSAEVRRTRANLNRAEAGREQSWANLREAGDILEIAQSRGYTGDRLSRVEQRYREAWDADDVAEARQEQAQAAYNRALANSRRAEASIAEAREAISQAEAILAEAQASQNKTQARLQDQQ